ncbi:MAG: hypothetical protein NXI30_09140 [bacterium]|nr:hypothetical protein [bacterium]
MNIQSHPIPEAPKPVGAMPMTRRRNGRAPRTVVHAGPLVLARDGAPRGLERYLEREEDRELILLHGGQSTLKEIARESGVNAVRLEEMAHHEEEAAAADMAIALGAEQLEFAIDDPCLLNDSGRPVRELTAYEARAYAADARVPKRIRAKLDAGCSALDRGLMKVRIGHPAALDRERATIVFPDPPLHFGVELREPEEPEPAEAREGDHPKRDERDRSPISEPTRTPEQPALDLRAHRRPKRVSRRADMRCEIGSRRPTPFPDLPEPYATYSIGSTRAPSRTRRRLARRS